MSGNLFSILVLTSYLYCSLHLGYVTKLKITNHNLRTKTLTKNVYQISLSPHNLIYFDMFISVLYAVLMHISVLGEPITIIPWKYGPHI